MTDNNICEYIYIIPAIGYNIDHAASSSSSLIMTSYVFSANGYNISA
jgi:hypothetical protein